MAYIKAVKAVYGVVQKSKIYGAKWLGTSDSSWIRTDAAALFPDPVPAVGNGEGWSPFDNIMPWAGMQIVEDAEAGTLVSIPKFYYRWIISGVTMQLQISMEQKPNFHCSPAHMDRGDGQGERDVVYIGRYHCASDYKSKTGVAPKANVTRATFRSNIHALGNEIWQNDFALFWTIRMLYLVEFADWDSQDKIGYGCSPSGNIANMGETDSMQYHTGTTASNRTTYGWTQYRWIEGLWDNVVDWCDGVYFSGLDVYAIKNPSNFSNDSNGIIVAQRPSESGYVSAFSLSNVDGYEYFIFPSEVNGSDTTYICDNCEYNSTGIMIFVGGSRSQNLKYGLFCISGSRESGSKSEGIGSRLMKLPNAA